MGTPCDVLWWSRSCPTAFALLAAWSYCRTPERVTPQASPATSRSIASRERSRYQCDDADRSMLSDGGVQSGSHGWTFGFVGSVGGLQLTRVTDCPARFTASAMPSSW